MNAILFFLSSFLPLRIISDGEGPYLERYYLFTIFGVRFYLHRFVASDPDRGLHDHPWPWAGSIVLSGHYWEVTRSGTKKVRWLNFLVGDSFHRVKLSCRHNKEDGICSHYIKTGISGTYHTKDGICTEYSDIKNLLHSPKNSEKPCWTLFFHRATYVKPWGFWEDSWGFWEDSGASAKWTTFDYPGNGSGTSKAWWKEVVLAKYNTKRCLKNGDVSAAWDVIPKAPDPVLRGQKNPPDDFGP